MNRDPKQSGDQLNAFLKGGDLVEQSALTGDAIESALDEIGAEITGRARVTSWRTRWLPTSKPRAALMIGFAAIGIGAAVAGGSLLLRAHTGEFQPTPQEIANVAKTNPEKAKTLQSYLDMGGPGEDLNPAAPDFRTVALQISSDIPWPDGYESWRDSLISLVISRSGGGEMTTGALHGWFAMSSFCAWVQAWRYADSTGNNGAAARAEQVISGAPGWKAVTDEDPHPDPTVPGDGGSTQSTLFGWMLPYRDAVQAGDRGRAEHLLVSFYYQGTCQFYDPDWRALLTAHREAWGGLSQAQLEQKYAQYLASRTS